MKILVFLQGTILIESNILGKSREVSVRKSIERANTHGPLGELVPIGNAVQKVNSWRGGGAEIFYLTVARKPENVMRSQEALTRHGFPNGSLLYRSTGESYADVASRILPDTIVEDDCESIGGEKEMVYPNMSNDQIDKVAWIVVKEFEGIDHLPDDPILLYRLGRRS